MQPEDEAGPTTLTAPSSGCHFDAIEYVDYRGDIVMKIGINGMGRIGRLALRAAMGAVLRPQR